MDGSDIAPGAKNSSTPPRAKAAESRRLGKVSCKYSWSMFNTACTQTLCYTAKRVYLFDYLSVNFVAVESDSLICFLCESQHKSRRKSTMEISLVTDSDTEGSVDIPKRVKLCTRAVDESGSDGKTEGRFAAPDYDMDWSETRMGFDNVEDVDVDVHGTGDGYVWIRQYFILSLTASLLLTLLKSMELSLSILFVRLGVPC